MKTLIIGALAITFLTYQVYHFQAQSDEFTLWKAKHNKLYSSTENTYRKNIFHQNLQLINDHNSRYEQGLETFQIGANLFADLTFEEFSSMYLYSEYPDPNVDRLHQERQQKKQSTKSSRKQIKDNEGHDWSELITNYDIISQQKCLGSWAFAVVGSLEISQYLAEYTQLSSQQLIDCVDQGQSNPCMGASVSNAWNYLKLNLLDTAEVQQYKGVQGQCTPSVDGVQLANVQQVDEFNDENVQTVLNTHAVVAPLSVSNIYFQLYKSGVFNGDCNSKLNYDGLIVGYGTLNEKPFYKLKMSWSDQYGDKGYISVGQDSNCFSRYSYATPGQE